LDKTIEKLTTSNYETEYEFNVGEYDSTIAFFVKRGFSRTSAESTAYVILSQAKIDNIKPQQILDKLTYASPALLVRTDNNNTERQQIQVQQVGCEADH
jgi:hypothetical protein